MPLAIDLGGNVAWVTGGSRGIGRATALALAEAGANVAIGYRDSAASAEETAEKARAFGVKAIAVSTDVGDADACERAADAIARELGPISVLVNSAGITRDGLFLTLGADEWTSVLQTNLMGTVHPTRAAAKGMWARKKGRIVNVSSVAAKGGSRGQSNYVASKGAIEALTRNLAVEFSSRNITVNCVAPGFTETDMVKDVDREATIARQLVKRIAQPGEIAAWIAMLASPHGAFITGQTLHIDGGLHMI